MVLFWGHITGVARMLWVGRVSNTSLGVSAYSIAIGRPPRAGGIRVAPNANLGLSVAEVGSDGRRAGHPHRHPGRRSSRPQVQAAIAVVHDEAPTAHETDWPQIRPL
jgi:hypothetical protein